MPARTSRIVAIGIAASLAVGCSSLMPFGRDEPRQTAHGPAPLPAAPTGSVTAAPLPPPGGTAAAPGPASGLAALDPALRTGAAGSPPGALPGAPGALGATPAAALPGAAPAAAPPPGGNVAVGRTDLLGGWTVAAAGDTCQLFMTLTTWSGGYRASTRGCSNAALTGISAWNMEGPQVQLLNDSGATLARLYPTSKTQFTGQTEGGGPITVSR